MFDIVAFLLKQVGNDLKMLEKMREKEEKGNENGKTVAKQGGL